MFSRYGKYRPFISNAIKTMREFLTAAVLAVLLLGYSAQANAQFATSDDEATTQRAERILENLKYQISELRELNVTMGEITSSEIDGLDEGRFTVNGQQKIGRASCRERV